MKLPWLEMRWEAGNFRSQVFYKTAQMSIRRSVMGSVDAHEDGRSTIIASASGEERRASRSWLPIRISECLLPTMNLHKNGAMNTFK